MSYSKRHLKQLRQDIKDVIDRSDMGDAYVIECIYDMLNIKHPLEQIVQDDLTLSEAVEKVYAIQSKYAHSGIDKKWVEVQLKSYEAIGLIKFKEKKNPLEDYLAVSSVIRDQIKTVFIHNNLIEHIGDKLRKACMTRFGDCWSNDTANLFARIAIEEYELQKAKDSK